jgi:spore germination protein YaaH
VEASLRSALDSIPREKLLLGLPLYHRRWSGTEVGEGTYSEALEVAARWGVDVLIDPLHREKRFRFEQAGASSEVWLQDSETLAERLRLVARYRLRGFSAWRLGHEDPAFWERVRRPAR